MEGRAAVECDALAELGQADAVAVAGDLLENGEGALERLDAAARGSTGTVPRVGTWRVAICIVIPAKAGIERRWTPACAGMSNIT
jgi:hypothetical protein